MTNEAEWISVQGTVQDLSHTEEMSALALFNLVPCSPDDQPERLKRFEESRGTGAADGEDDGRHYSDDDIDEDDTEFQENLEESTCKSDEEGGEGISGQDDTHDSRGSWASTPQHQGQSSHCHSSNKHLHSCQGSWGSKCKSEGAEESERVSTQEEDMVTKRFSESARLLEDDGESSHEDDTDDKPTDGESSQLSVPISQEPDPLTQNHPTGAEPLKVEAEV